MPDPLRVGVLVLADLSQSGGTSIRTCGIANRLVDYGCEVTLISSHPPPAELSRSIATVDIGSSYTPKRRLSVLHVAFPKALFWLRYVPDAIRLRQAVHSQDLDILHVHGHASTYHLVRLRPYIDAPILFDMHGIIHLQMEDFALLGASDQTLKLHLGAERNVLKLVDAVSVVSDKMRDYVTSRFNVPPDRVHVIPDAVDPQLFSKEVSEEEQTALRDEHGLAGKRVVLFAGSFKKLGGVLDLVEAYGHLVRDMSDPPALVMIGDGQLMPQVVEFRRRHRLSDLVLVGPVPHCRLPVYQSIADVLVVPECLSQYNDMVPHIKLLECLASGRPTVATRLGSVSEIVEDGKNGILVAPSQPKQLAEAIARVLRDHSLQRRLSIGARQAIGYERTWAHSACKAVEAYRTILSRKPERATRGRPEVGPVVP